MMFYKLLIYLKKVINCQKVIFGGLISILCISSYCFATSDPIDNESITTEIITPATDELQHSTTLNDADIAIDLTESKQESDSNSKPEPEPESEQQPILEDTNKTEHIVTKTIFSLLGDAKYPSDFVHFDYVNPEAPKGGTLKLAQVGSYDNFNRRASRGVRESNLDMIDESLFTQSADDITSFYPLLANSITYSDSYQWAEVELNPNARFSDGIPVTADDVVFTYQKMMAEGVSQYRVYNAGIEVTAIDPLHVRFDMPESNRERLFDFVGSFSVIPKHFWQDKNLAEPLPTPPIGSGPYVIKDYKLGQYAVYQLNEDYWGKDLPVNRGINNFTTKHIEYYLDDNVALEAFKAGEYDLRGEAQPKNWFTQYQGPYFDNQSIIKQQSELTTATGTRWLAFNLQKPIFSDIRVRQAITLAFDFAWLNHAFYYDSYKQPQSFFENTIYAAKGEPNELELGWLNQYKDSIASTAFDTAYQIPLSDASGFNRDNLLKAKQLLEDAGWVVQNNQLINQQTKQPFEFELLTYMGSDNKYAIPFQQNLARLGIKMTISSVDYNQITFRLRKRDYDMIPTMYSAFPYPTSSLAILWGSNYLTSSWNSSGLHNQAIDGLIDQIAEHIDDQTQLTALTSALDRVLTHEYAMIPMWYPKYTYYAYWDKFDQPAIKPIYGIGIDSWWFDQDKASALAKTNSSNTDKQKD